MDDIIASEGGETISPTGHVLMEPVPVAVLSVNVQFVSVAEP